LNEQRYNTFSAILHTLLVLKFIYYLYKANHATDNTISRVRSYVSLYIVKYLSNQTIFQMKVGDLNELCILHQLLLNCPISHF